MKKKHDDKKHHKELLKHEKNEDRLLKKLERANKKVEKKLK